jgi:hypothetical protein
MRSASMPLLGFEETRISWSSDARGDARGDARTDGAAALFGGDFFFCGCFGTRFDDTGTSVGERHGAKRLRQANAQSLGRGHRREAPAEKRSELAVYGDADLAVGAVAQMNLECVLLLMAETTVEKEVNHAFYIITEHPVSFRGHVVIAYVTPTPLQFGEFRERPLKSNPLVPFATGWPRRKLAALSWQVAGETRAQKDEGGREAAFVGVPAS